jgi:hypothetical protein
MGIRNVGLSQILGCAILPFMSSPLVESSLPDTVTEPIIVYFIDHHPLESIEDTDPFRWLQIEEEYLDQLEGIIGSFNPRDVRIMRDRDPAGPAWKSLLDGLVDGDVRMVVTHLAPLTSGQRQQLIGVCATTGASLITPGDGGRNSTNTQFST